MIFIVFQRKKFINSVDFLLYMEFNYWIGLYILVGVYLVYRLFFKKNKFDVEYEKMYNKVLNSKEYKVKGQFEK